MNPDRRESEGPSGEPDFKLGDWWVRSQRNELERGTEIVRLEARSMEVLVCLARHAPSVVTKQRLLEEVWSDSPFVGEEVISHAVWELRKALGDSARDPEFIKTVPRKGYLLLAEVLRPEGSAIPVEGARIDHYQICEEIGRGSMGLVFKAIDLHLERTVAVKFLAPELTRDQRACKRFRREARLAASLDHPNLATIHAIGETAEAQLYLVSPYYSGGSLKDRCAQGSLTWSESTRLAHQLASGLAAAHGQGIVHRDIKPANLLLDEHGTLKIADFGIAKLLGTTDLTRTGVSLGTPAYRSPEQSRGQEVDHRTDIWSFGVVFFEMLTGRRPFDGEYDQAVVHSILSLEPAVETDVQGRPIPELLRRIVAKAMAKDPKDRYQSAVELFADLEDPEAVTIAGSVPAPPKRRWKLWAAGSSSALLILFSIYWGAKTPSPAAAHRPSREAVHRLSQGSDLWIRGNDGQNLAETEVQLEMAVEMAPDWPEALGLLAAFRAERFSLEKRDEDRREAERLIDAARRREPDFALAWAAQSRLHLVDGEYEGARAAAERALEREPICGHGENCDLGYVWLGEALWGLGRIDEAIARWEACFKEGNGHIRCRLKRAQFHASNGNREKAILDYEAVLENDPKQSTALNDLGNLYNQTRQYEDAAALFRRLFAATEDPRALLNLGNALYERQQFCEAIDAYQRAATLYPAAGLPPALPALALGDAYRELGEMESAQAAYSDALEVFDELAARANPAMKDLALHAVCMAKLGRYDEAEEAIRGLLSQQEEYPFLLVWAARIAALAGDREILYSRARRAVEAGISPNLLTNDAAFIEYRNDGEYLRLLEPGPLPPD